MNDALLANELPIRLLCFGGILLAMALWEVAAPRRALEGTRRARWPNNLGVVALNTILLRLIFPLPAVAFALLAGTQGWGLFNHFGLPAWLAVLAAVIILDFAIYLQHVMFHAVPVLWRLHRMHHADIGFDVTTGLRFHPVEILLSMGIKLAVIAVIGAPALGVLVFEVLLNGTAMFNHGNVRIPAVLDRVVRWVLVTPDMHRVHHSDLPDETNSNFGFNLSWWDRLCGTYQAQPALGHQGMTIGLRQFRDARELRLDRMLTQPVRGAAVDYPINRRPGG
jgi:sterol desaturase/sphingolipid hydroxylase (fatty acid hydroxylase superfamily)